MSQEKSAEEKKQFWLRRFIDPKLRAKWIAEIEVVPANREKGLMHGLRKFPDGRTEVFHL